MAELECAGDGACRVAGDEPGQGASELPGGQVRWSALHIGDPVGAAGRSAVVVDPCGEGSQLSDGAGAPGDPACGGEPGGGEGTAAGRGEQESPGVGLETFEDGYCSGDGGGHDPRRLHTAGIDLALEGQTRQLVPVDLAVRVSAGGDTSGLEVLDYWRRGPIRTVRYSPPLRRITVCMAPPLLLGSRDGLSGFRGGDRAVVMASGSLDRGLGPSPDSSWRRRELRRQLSAAPGSSRGDAVHAS